MEVVRKPARADAIIAFVEKLKITVGKKSGQPFILDDFQKRFIRDVYEPEDFENPGVKLVTKAVLSVGRKNGKSELAAALVLASLLCPAVCERNGSIISGATTYRQARMVFDAVVRFMNSSPILYRYLKVVDSTSTIYVRGSDLLSAGSQYRAIAAGAGAAQGLNPSLIIMDELAQAPNRKFFDALLASQGARAQPLMIVISTQADDPMHVLSTTIDDGLRTLEDGSAVDPRTVVHLYAAKPGCDIMDEAEWYASNPGLTRPGQEGGWIDYARFKAEAATALRNPAEEAQFRLYRLNQRVSPNAPLIGSFDWRECGPYRGQDLSAPILLRTQADFQFETGEKVYGGLDMSAHTDLTGLVMISAEGPSRCKAFAFKCASHIHDHGIKDAQRYDLFRDRGWLTAVPGRSIDPSEVVKKIAELNSDLDIQGIAFDRDPKHMDELLRVFERHDFGEKPPPRLVPWGQGHVSMDVAVKALEAAVLNRSLEHDGNPLLTWNISNAAVDWNREGNMRKLTKLTPRFRIDLAVCLAMALGLKVTEEGSTGPQNPWSDPEFDYGKWAFG